jgi:hypothetical protein
MVHADLEVSILPVSPVIQSTENKEQKMQDQIVVSQSSDLRAALEKAARKLADAFNDIQALEVETRWVELKANVMDEKAACLVAMTRIELDGDTKVIIPVKNQQGEFVPDQLLLDIHKEAVANAMEYRMNLIDMIMNGVRARAR